MESFSFFQQNILIAFDDNFWQLSKNVLLDLVFKEKTNKELIQEQNELLLVLNCLSDFNLHQKKFQKICLELCQVATYLPLQNKLCSLLQHN